MTIYNDNNVPVLYVPDQKLGLSEEGWNEFKAFRDAGREALYAASDNVQDALRALTRARSTAAADGSEENQSRLKAAQEAYDAARESQAEAESKYFFMGHSVVIHNKAPLGPDGQPLEGGVEQTHTGIGASDLDEAMKETIGGFDLSHVGLVGQSSDGEFTPDWVASTHPLLGKLLADYYDCELRDLAEVL